MIRFGMRQKRTFGRRWCRSHEGRIYVSQHVNSGYVLADRTCLLSLCCDRLKFNPVYMGCSSVLFLFVFHISLDFENKTIGSNA